MFIVTNATKQSIKAAAITFGPGESKPTPLTAGQQAQINNHPSLSIAAAVTAEIKKEA